MKRNVWKMFIIASITLALSCGGGGNGSTDNQPTLDITAPLANDTVIGTVLVEANASDDLGIASVEFYLDDVLRTTANAAPYNWSFDTTSVANGAHTIKVRACDTSSQCVEKTVSITVSNIVSGDAPPTLDITSPANNATISGTVTVAAQASDDLGIAKVEFYLDDILQTTVTTAPYSWSLDTTAVANGAHTIKAKICDTGNQCVEKSISVTISNAAPVDNAPTVSITSPLASATVSGTITIAMTATDDNGVNKVSIQIDSDTPVDDATLPYSLSWDTTAKANGNHTIKAIAYDTAGQTAQAQITVLVQNTPPDQPPSVNITNPTNGSTVAGTVNVTATANDDNGVAKVCFQVDAGTETCDTSSPYEYSWNTKLAANASHTIKAVATDTASQAATATVTVTVNNPAVASIDLTLVSGSAPVESSYLLIPMEYDGSNPSYYQVQATPKDSGGNPISGITCSLIFGDSSIASGNSLGGNKFQLKTLKDWFNSAAEPTTTVKATCESMESAVLNLKSIANLAKWVNIADSNKWSLWETTGTTEYFQQEGRSITTSTLTGNLTNNSISLDGRPFGCLQHLNGTVTNRNRLDGTWQNDWADCGNNDTGNWSANRIGAVP